MAGRLLAVVLIYLLHSPTQALLPPKLTVNKQLITETDSVTLSCQAPTSLSVFRYYLVVVNTESTTEISCLTSVPGRELLRRSQQIPPAVVQLKCFYTLKYGELNSPSAHSNISPITVQGVLQTTSGPVASTLGTPASGSKSRPSTLTPPTSASDVVTSWLPTRTQTHGESSGSSHPASSWSTAGWTLAPADTLLTSSPKPGGAAADERDEKTKDKAGRVMVKVVIAVASFGLAVGVILLGLSLRRIVSERTRRSAHQSIEDEYHLYSTITDELAPSVKENMVYSKVEAH